MRVLGIETSCDETSAAVVETGWNLRSNVIASQADLHARSTGALAAALTGRQSEVLASPEELARASEAAWERAREEPGAPVPTWTLYRLRPDEVEFFQGDARRRHVRLVYRRTEAGWVKELLWP